MKKKNIIDEKESRVENNNILSRNRATLLFLGVDDQTSIRNCVLRTVTGTVNIFGDLSESVMRFLLAAACCLCVCFFLLFILFLWLKNEEQTPHVNDSLWSGVCGRKTLEKLGFFFCWTINLYRFLSSLTAIVIML